MGKIELLLKNFVKRQPNCQCNACRILDKEGEKVFGRKEWIRMKNGK
jgi:hypothetical protein